MSKYVRITVHEDVFKQAVNTLSVLEARDGYDDPHVQTLRDLLDPLPEQDVFGITPSAQRLTGDEVRGEWGGPPPSPRQVAEAVLEARSESRIRPGLTPASAALFGQLVSMAPDWSGQPLVELTARERGNLTDLKVKGLLTTNEDEGNMFVAFTDAGIDLAVEMGFAFMEDYR